MEQATVNLLQHMIDHHKHFASVRQARQGGGAVGGLKD